jgi:hypothetical protein
MKQTKKISVSELKQMADRMFGNLAVIAEVVHG